MNSDKGSFQLRAFCNTAVSASNINPQLFDGDSLITQKLNLNGRYRLKIKCFDARWNQNLTYVNPTIFFVSPNVVGSASEDNYVSLFAAGTTTNLNVTAGLSGGLDHELLADLRGSISYNAVFANPFFGNTPFPASNVKTGTYNIVPSASTQAIFATLPTVFQFSINIDYEAI
jgi:hypothetical protein